MEVVLSRYPDYIKVKDLPHDDTAYKVSFLGLISCVHVCSVKKGTRYYVYFLFKGANCRLFEALLQKSQLKMPVYLKPV